MFGKGAGLVVVVVSVVVIVMVVVFDVAVAVVVVLEIVVDDCVTVFSVVVNVVVVLDAAMHESQRTGQCRLICVPAKLLRVQPDARYGLLRPHSSGSPAPLHTPVVVVVVAVVDAKQESHPIGQSVKS